MTQEQITKVGAFAVLLGFSTSAFISLGDYAPIVLQSNGTALLKLHTGNLRSEIVTTGISVTFTLSLFAFPIIGLYYIAMKAIMAYRSNLSKPSGSWLLGFAQTFLRKKQIAIVEEEIADMRQEVDEALDEKRWLRARWLPVLYAMGLSWSALKWVVHEFAGVGKVE